MKKKKLEPDGKPHNFAYKEVGGLSTGYYYEEKNSISVYSDRGFVGFIGKHILLKSLSRIYGIDFFKLIPKK